MKQTDAILLPAQMTPEFLAHYVGAESHWSFENKLKHAILAHKDQRFEVSETP